MCTRPTSPFRMQTRTEWRKEQISEWYCACDTWSTIFQVINIPSCPFFPLSVANSLWLNNLFLLILTVLQWRLCKIYLEGMFFISHFFSYRYWGKGLEYGPLEFEGVKKSNDIFFDCSVPIYRTIMTFLHYHPGWNLNDWPRVKQFISLCHPILFPCHLFSCTLFPSSVPVMIFLCQGRFSWLSTYICCSPRY